MDAKKAEELGRNLNIVTKYINGLDTLHVPLKGGVVVPLEFDADALHDAEMRVGLNNTWGDKLNDPKTHTDTLIALFTVFMNCGFRHTEGNDFAPIGEDWVKAHMTPYRFFDYEMAIRKVLARGGETEEDDGSGERDLVLERIKKTKVNEGLHTAASSTTD